jgi:hypothetical protein
MTHPKCGTFIRENDWLEQIAEKQWPLANEGKFQTIGQRKKGSRLTTGISMR